MSPVPSDKAVRRVVGVNLLWLVPGVVGGSEEYTVRCLAGLAERMSPDIEIRLFALEAFAEAHREVAEAFETVLLRLDGRRKSIRVAAEHSWLAGQAWRHRLDLLHHAGGVVPVVHNVPAVLTIHDLQPLVMPENFSRVKLAYLRLMLPRSARAVRIVVTPSEHAGRSVVDTLGVAPERVMTVPSGIDITAIGPPDPAEERRVRGAYGLTGPFFLLPAITYPHKNHLMLLRAFADLVVTHKDVTLVLTGGEATSEESVRTEIARLGLTDRVKRLGRVPRPDIDALFDAATALTFPSVFEGFGIPVLEAMAHGCPVISANTTALPDVVGDAGILVSPYRPSEWTRAMAEVLDRPERRKVLRRSGLARATHFDWGRSADALERAYVRALDRPVPARPRSIVSLRKLPGAR
jgi:alpha-1,3-rhamnosyl/mannosyltransferase